MTQYSEQDKIAAKKWFSSLPAGRKNYFKAHFGLNSDAKITRFWVNNIKVHQDGSL